MTDPAAGFASIAGLGFPRTPVDVYCALGCQLAAERYRIVAASELGGDEAASGVVMGRRAQGLETVTAPISRTPRSGAGPGCAVPPVTPSGLASGRGLLCGHRPRKSRGRALIDGSVNRPEG